MFQSQNARNKEPSFFSDWVQDKFSFFCVITLPGQYLVHDVNLSNIFNSVNHSEIRSVLFFSLQGFGIDRSGFNPPNNAPSTDNVPPRVIRFLGPHKVPFFEGRNNRYQREGKIPPQYRTPSPGSDFLTCLRTGGGTLFVRRLREFFWKQIAFNFPKTFFSFSK